MARKNNFYNPFYLILCFAGAIFFCTAAAYGIMLTLLNKQSAATAYSDSQYGFIDFFDHYGIYILVAEIAIITIATFAAIATDEYWEKRAKRKEDFNNIPEKERE